jgi:hypothetical protein
MTLEFTTLDDAADPTFNQLLSINDSGTIAGYFGSGAPGHPNKGYTLSSPFGQGDYTNENFPTSAQTQVTGINNEGTTVGFWVDGQGDNFGFVDEHGGTFTTAIDPAAASGAAGGPITEQFLGVNNKDQVAGFYTDANGNSHGFVYNIDTNSFVKVHVPGATSVTATDINDQGDISGFFQKGGATEGFLEVSGHVYTLSGPAGATDVQALGLNNKDQVVGSYVGAHGNTHGFLYSNTTNHYTTINDPNAAGSTVVNGINNKGDMVGFYTDAAGNTDGMAVGTTGHSHGVEHGMGHLFG